MLFDNLHYNSKEVRFIRIESSLYSIIINIDIYKSKMFIICFATNGSTKDERHADNVLSSDRTGKLEK